MIMEFKALRVPALTEEIAVNLETLLSDLPGVEHGGRLFLPYDPTAHGTTLELDLDLPSCRPLGTFSQCRSGKVLSGGIEGWDDVARRLWI